MDAALFIILTMNEKRIHEKYKNASAYNFE